MKKLLLLALLTIGLSASAQSYFWTNGLVIYTNLSIGNQTVPLTSNAFFALQWCADTWNAQQNLTGTNRFKVKDVICYAGQWICDQKLISDWQTAMQAQADSKAAVRRLKDYLNSFAFTETQLSNACRDFGLPYP